MGIGKSVLKQRQTERPPKLSQAELKELQEYQERMKELAEQRKAQKLDAESEGKVELPKQEMPSDIVEAKEDYFGEVAPVAEQMSNPQSGSETEAKPEPEIIKPKRQLK